MAGLCATDEGWDIGEESFFEARNVGNVRRERLKK